MEHRFDELAKALAEGVSRREALRRFAGGLAGALLASMGLKPALGGGFTCLHFCRAPCTKAVSSDACASCVDTCKRCEDSGLDFCAPNFETFGCCPPGAFCVRGECDCKTDNPHNPREPTCGGSNGLGGVCCQSGQYCAGACGCCPVGQICQAVGTLHFCGSLCATGLTNCNGACVNTSTDTNNCGACGNTCPMGASCTNGTCQCPTGTIVCGAYTLALCVHPLFDPNNCGGCGITCATGQPCQNGQCGCNTNQPCPTGQVCYSNFCVTACPGSLIDCKGSCTDTSSDPTNCGTCGNVCATGASCINSNCACPSGEMVCNGACVNTQTDGGNCGSCGNACPAGQMCANGKCALNCSTGTTNCSGSCVDLTSNNSNCGACGTVCPAGASCTNSACACPTGQTACSNTCTNLQTDNNNCGGCGVRCGGTTPFCSGGNCVQCQTDSDCSAPANGTATCGSSGMCVVNCNTNYTACSGKCVNTANDANNCGACGTVCPNGEACGTCQPGRCTCTTPTSLPSSACPAGQTCLGFSNGVGGTCPACG